MVQLTVFLFRCGETEEDAYEAGVVPEGSHNKNTPSSPPLSPGVEDSRSGEFVSGDNDHDADDDIDDDIILEEVDEDDDFARSPRKGREKRGKKKMKQRRSSSPVAQGQIKPLRRAQKVDPSLTSRGFEQAQDTISHLFRGLAASCAPSEMRRMAAIAAPFKSCVGTALMMSCARLPTYDNLMFRLTTFEAAKAPTAIPVVLINGLCNGAPEIVRLGGHKAVIQGGLLHCAADPFNDGRNKCPIMKCVYRIRLKTKDRVEEWKQSNREEQRRVTDVQYFRLATPTDPWSLEKMTPQVNILVDQIEPNKYLTPPRHGSFDSKLHDNKCPWKIGPEKALRYAVWKAREVGCDTVICFVPGSIMQQLAVLAGHQQDDNPAPPCSLTTIIATMNDNGNAKEGEESVMFQFDSFLTAEELAADPSKAVPSFLGRVNVLVSPPEGCDPDSVPVNQWSRFKPLPPENIPDNYPKLPPFRKSLDLPIPNLRRRPAAAGGGMSVAGSSYVSSRVPPPRPPPATVKKKAKPPVDTKMKKKRATTKKEQEAAPSSP